MRQVVILVRHVDGLVLYSGSVGGGGGWWDVCVGGGKGGRGGGGDVFMRIEKQTRALWGEW